MKRMFPLFLAAGLMVFSTSAYAGPGENLTNGLKTFVMSPKQIPDNIKQEYDSHDNKPLALIGGTMKGFFYFGKDLIGGGARALTFPFDCNKK